MKFASQTLKRDLETYFVPCINFQIFPCHLYPFEVGGRRRSHFDLWTYVTNLGWYWTMSFFHNSKFLSRFKTTFKKEKNKIKYIVHDRKYGYLTLQLIQVYIHSDRLSVARSTHLQSFDNITGYKMISDNCR